MATTEPSRLYDLEAIDITDNLDVELSRLYALHYNTSKDKSENELHNYLQEKASKSKNDYSEVNSALLYGILTDADNAPFHFQCLSLVNRDGFGTVLEILHNIAMSISFHRLKQRVTDQIIWLISELTTNNVQNTGILYLCLLRQIKGGDTSARVLRFCEQILIPTVAYTFLRLIADHKSPQLQSLQSREIRFVVPLIREKWLACCSIGRDLLRILYDIKSIPEFAELWNDIIHAPQSLSPKFSGIESLFKCATPREFLQCRLTPDMEEKLLFILQKLKVGQYHRNLGWFIQRFLMSECEPFYVDIIRFIVAGWYPNNQILQSDIVPRYVIIGSIMRGIKSSSLAENMKRALIYDWLFFTPKDNIMFIEPAMLLMERSAERYPYITATILEHLKKTVSEFFPSLKDNMLQGVTCGMRIMLEKGVIRSLVPIYKCTSLNESTRGILRELFGEFLSKEVPNAPVPPMPISPTLQPPLLDQHIAELPTDEQGRISSDQGEQGASDSQLMDEEDVDRFLYGNPDKDQNVESASGDVEMDGTSAQDDETPLFVPVAEQGDESDQTIESMDEVIKHEEENNDTLMTQKDWMEEEEESAEGMQSNQSYWIFGSSITRFKDACKAVGSTVANQDNDVLEEQMSIVKQTLKDILSVFLRMAMSADTLASTIGSSLRNVMLTYSLTSPSQTALWTEESLMSDVNKGPFDIILNVLWQERQNNSHKNKLVQLIGCLAIKGKPHLVTMRWWFSVANWLEAHPMPDDQQVEWTPVLVGCYDHIITYIMNEQQIMVDKRQFLGEYLVKDLKWLAECRIPAFHIVIPFVYLNMTGTASGNLPLAKLVVNMILPDLLGKLAKLLQLDRIRMFNDDFDATWMVPSAAMDAYEMMALWQLISAELQGRQDRIEHFLSRPEFSAIVYHQQIDEILPSLLSMLISAQPTTTLCRAIVDIIRDEDTSNDSTTEFVLTVLLAWSHHCQDTLQKSLIELARLTSDRLTNEESPSSEIDQAMGRKLVYICQIWWSHSDKSEMSETCINNRNLLSIMAFLGNQCGRSYPTEWTMDMSRRRTRVRPLDSNDSDE